MKGYIVVLAFIVSVAIGLFYNVYSNVMDYTNINLIRFSDGVMYNKDTNTIYTKGQNARWYVKRAETAFLESGDDEFYMDNGLPTDNKNYKCVLVKRIVYDNNK